MLKHWLISRSLRLSFAGQMGTDGSRELFWFLIPIIAITSFDATASQMGVLFVLRDLPVVVFSLFAGVALDRFSIRKLMMGGALVFALLMALASGSLSLDSGGLWWLYGLAFLVGSLNVFLDIGITTLLPLIVARTDLVRSNSVMMVGRSAVAVLAPGLAGLLTRIMTPAATLIFGAATSLVGLLAFSRLHEVSSADEAATHKPATISGVISDIRAGFGVLFEIRVLRALILISCIGAFGFGAAMALLVFALSRDLGLEPWAVGMVLAVGNGGTVFGSLICSRITARLGEGPTMLLGDGMAGIAYTLLALAVAFQWVLLGIVAVVLAGIGTAIFAISQISIRQAVTPRALMGRANATRRFIVFSFVPLGAFASGWLAEWTTTTFGLLLGAVGIGGATILGLFTPLRKKHIEGFNA